ncbi:hypothetical protein JVU11DRAFT_4349 [Chiua virens]|nr:hypothetical protein JVU11DRAFT_4349 [Chiua virens]
MSSSTLQLTLNISGDRAEWGYLHSCCMHCAKRVMYGQKDLDQGAFASHAVWKALFLIHIPDSISSADAAPFMCAGSTVFHPVYSHVQPTERVGIVGIRVLDTSLSSLHPDSKQEVMERGATEFYATKDVSKLEIGWCVNHLIITTPALPDWNL